MRLQTFLIVVSLALVPWVHARMTLPPTVLLADGQPKFLGCAYSEKQVKGFSQYWNKVTPEDAGKWGSVEAVCGHMD
ncbi:hypothetical protein [Rhodanobacter sp. 115]|uniref:hypothetical protein n=1 Tax=Rhodanobacter sp. FW021-MT20 TaxID=1162282 RepID=UPI0002D66F43|nr:hypothetical protein [Rhodanobacter sp. 115]